MSRRAELWDEFRQAILDADIAELRALLADPQLPAIREDWSTNQSQSLFGLALSRGSAEMVSAIVEADRSGDFWDPVNCRSESFDGKTRITPLAVALQANNESVVSWLVKQGADVNAACRWSDRAEDEVEVAEFFGDFEHGVCKGVCWWLASEEVLELMIGKGLDPDAADDDKRTMDRPDFCRQSVAALRVAPLKLYRGQPASGTVPADWVVKHLDVVEDI